MGEGISLPEGSQDTATNFSTNNNALKNSISADYPMMKQPADDTF